MADKRRGLGRGLDALLGGGAVDLSGGQPDKLRSLAIERLQPSRFQPRKAIDPERLRELADSISAQGVVQPVVARATLDGRYEIIAGERRWRAAQLAGLREIPVMLREVSDQTALAIALIENIQREDLNPLEAAEAMQKLLEEHALTHQQLADAVGKSRASVSNLLRLNELHPEVKPMLLDGRIEMGHARAILGLERAAQAEVARVVVQKKLTVRATEALIKRLREGAKVVERIGKDPDVKRLEEDLSDRFGTLVSIRQGPKGGGQIVIQYTSLEQLEGVLARLR